MWVRDYRSRIRKLEAAFELRIADASVRGALVQIIPESGRSKEQRIAATKAKAKGIEVIECFVVDQSIAEAAFL